MKKLTLAICVAAFACGIVVCPRGAEAQIPGARLTKLVTTKVAGTINVTIPQQLLGLQCSDLDAYAIGAESPPKVTRSAAVTGTALNACAYSITVPANYAFKVSLSGDPTDKCPAVIGFPASPTTLTVPAGTTKIYNFNSQLLCFTPPS